MWELDYKESWALKNWLFWTVVLEKTLESPLECKEIQPVHPGGKSVLNIHWKDWCWSWSSNTLATWCEELTIGKDPDAGKDWRQEKGTTEVEMAGWHHWLDGTWVWASSGSWWWTGKRRVLQSMESQGVGSNWTELIVDLQRCVNFCYTAKWLSSTYICIRFYILFYYGLSWDSEYSSWCYIVGPCCPPILYIIVCIY